VKTTRLISALSIAALAGGALLLWKNHIARGTGATPDTAGHSAPWRPAASPGKDPEARMVSRWRPLLDDSLPKQVRLDIARGIDENLGPAEIAFLYQCLSHKPSPGNENAWWVVMNEIMEQMRKKGVGAGDYTAAMISIIRDPASHDVARDYAVQHLAQWIAPAGGTTVPGETDARCIEDGLQAIASLINDPALSLTTIPGTALMALVDASSRLERGTTEAIWESLSPFFAAVITGQTPAEMPLRVSVLQAVAIQGDTRHLPAIRLLARDEKANPSLRLSSIASLGFYGEPADIAFLQSLANTDTPFRHAATAALARIPGN
jgi:hypothetical protein